MCKTAWFYLYQIEKTKKYLTQVQLKSVVHAHVISRLDYNNSLVIGVLTKNLNCLQVVENSAARLVASLRKRDQRFYNIVPDMTISLPHQPLYCFSSRTISQTFCIIQQNERRACQTTQIHFTSYHDNGD